MSCVTPNGILMTNDARVFIAEGGVGCGRRYEYDSCKKVTGLSKSFGEAEPIYCPDPNRANAFIEVGSIQGEEGRWTSTITGPKPFNLRSRLARLAGRRGCEFNLQVHFGRCVDPTQFNAAQHVMVIEGARISDYSTSDLVALNPGESAVVEETVSFSARNIYELFEQNLFRSATELTSSLMALSVAYAPGYGSLGCGDSCDVCDPSCNDYYILGVPHVISSNGQPVYILHTQDGGVSWSSYQIPCSAVSASSLEAYEIVAAGDKLIVTLNEFGGPGHLFSVPIRDIVNGLTNGVSFLSTGHTTYDQWNHQGVIWSVGADGRITAIDANALTISVVESGANYPQDWYAIHGCDNDNIIVGGAAGQFAYRRKGSSFQNRPIIFDNTVVAENIFAVSMKSQNDWYVGTQDGNLYCTSNCGATWDRSSAFAGCIKALKFITENVGYAVIGFPASIYRTIDGGTTWQRVNDEQGQIPSGAILHDIAACPDDPNHFVAVGRVPASPPISPCDIVAQSATGETGLVLVGQT